MEPKMEKHDPFSFLLPCYHPQTWETIPQLLTNPQNLGRLEEESPVEMPDQ